MTPNKPKRLNKVIKRLLILATVVIVIILALHIWFVNNARSVLKSYISEQSGGKIKLELSSLDLNMWTRRIKIHEADLVSTDSVNQPITYHVKFNELSLEVASLWSLLIDKELLLDSIKLYDPEIQVNQWRRDTAKQFGKEELSIPQEMGKIYKSMLSALDEFGIRRIIIENAKISLVNKMKPGSEPVTVSNIYFDLARTPVGKGKKPTYIENEQSVQLRTAHQDITLPGGRHRLSFKSFRLGLYGQRIDLDSCTVTAIATDSLKSNYRIFFKKLSLTGVDFTAMSALNMIKADSVYCEEPMFDFNLYRSDAVKKQAVKIDRPDPDVIIRELMGNLNLDYVGVKNAGIHFDIYGKTKRSFFNSNKDNFELHGLKIDSDSAQPVTVRKFDMTLRDYRLYNGDSSSITSFDSLHFLNNKIVLHNFAILTRPGIKIRNPIDIKIPFFELTQLDWYQLIFDQNLVASSAVLNSPVINYSRKDVRRKTGTKTNLFAAIQNLDSLVALDNITVLNGNVNMQLGPSTFFNVEDVNFNIRSNKLLRSTTKEGLRSAVENLSFSKGLLKLRDITARLGNARLTDENLVYADRISITGKRNNINAVINQVNINNLILDDNAQTLELDGLKWNSATVKMLSAAGPKSRKEGNNISVRLRNVAGNNTHLYISGDRSLISAYIQKISAESMLKDGRQMELNGFVVSGNDLSIVNQESNLAARAFNISGNAVSTISGLQMRHIKGRDSINIESSEINFTANINDLLNNKLQFSNVDTRDLTVKLHKWETGKPAVVKEAGPKKSPLLVDKINAPQIDLQLFLHRNDSVTVINIPGGNIKATGVSVADEIQIGDLSLISSAGTILKANGEMMGVEKGKIDLQLSNLHFGKRNDTMSWGGLVNSIALEGVSGLNMGKSKNLKFENIYLGNIDMSSTYLPRFGELLQKNLSAWIRIPQGEFIDSLTTIKWYNANFSSTSRTLTLDSFVYHPTRSLDSVLAHAPYQLDYVTMKTGAVKIDGFDVVQYEKDSSFSANSINIKNPLLTIFRDKKPPVSPYRKEKPLPVDLIRKIPLPVAVDSLELEDGIIVYSERNAKSREEGNLLLSNVYATLSNIRNRNLLPADSLELQFNAKLMDTVDISVNVKESYTDSMSGFLIRGSMKSTALSIINPVLIPLSNVKITSGVLDSLSFIAVGRKDVALGEMDMHYHDLKIKLIKAGDPTQSTFVQNVTSFIANAFFVKNFNTRRTGVIYFNRLENQSFVNYVVKMTLSGMASSVGAKKNRKYLKDYRKEIKASGKALIDERKTLP